MINWIMFSMLGLIWGSSFLLIKLAVPELGPLPLVSIRLGLASIAFLVMLAVLKRKFPSDRRTWLDLLLVGLLNTAIPFVLITWGEQSIDSGLAGVLNGSVPLFSVILAHFFLHDEKIYLGKILGVIAGFAGLLLLAVRTINPEHQSSFAGQTAVVVAAVCYAMATVYMRRRLRHVDAMVTAGVSLCFGATTVIVTALLTVHPLPNLANLSAQALLSSVALGLINTFVAYILFFNLIANWGAARSTMVTYTMPPISLLLGAIFNHEHLDPIVLIASALIIGGVLLANLWRPRPKPTMTEAAQSIGR